MEKRKGKLTVNELNIINQQYQLTDEELFEKFINAKKLEGVSDKTIDLYNQTKRVVLRDIALININKPMSQLNKKEIESLILYWIDAVAIATVNNRIRVIKVYYKTLYRLNYLKANPMKEIHQVKEKTPIKPTLTEIEVKRLTDYYKTNATYAKYRNLVIFQLLLDTGIRVGELTSLQVSDVQEDTIIIRETKSKMQRVVYPSKKCMTAIESYLKIRAEFNSPYLFVTNTGTPVKIRMCQQNLAIDCKNAGINKKVSPQMLRRTYAKFAIMNGIDPFSLAKLLGHEDLQTTKRYVQIYGADLKVQSKKRGNFDRYF